MIDLEEEIKKRGETVLHIKTDSIKIPDTDKHDEKFIMDFGKKYGYNFEYEANYNKICLVNKAVYIAKYSDDIDINGDNAGKWTATGAEFAHPYIFKKLFSGECMDFRDFCETKAVTSNMYLREKDGNLIFVGKVGSFVPMKNGLELLRESEEPEGRRLYMARRKGGAEAQGQLPGMAEE